MKKICGEIQPSIGCYKNGKKTKAIPNFQQFYGTTMEIIRFSLIKEKRAQLYMLPTSAQTEFRKMAMKAVTT